MWKLRLVVISIFLLFSFICEGTSFVPGYELTNVQQTTWGMQGSLSRIAGSSGPYGGDIDNLSLYVYYQSEDVLRIKIVDPANARWEVPDVIQVSSPPTNPPATKNYRVDLINSPFGLSVSRVTDGVTLWNTSSPTTGTQFNGLIVYFSNLFHVEIFQNLIFFFQNQSLKINILSGAVKCLIHQIFMD